MNFTAATNVSAATETSAVDGLVIEDFARLADEPFQPGTCICWSVTHAAE
ncbi:hypothetical protein ACFVW8_23815 [Streptomyces sp. NPDC058221]